MPKPGGTPVDHENPKRRMSRWVRDPDFAIPTMPVELLRH
jgi:hypothetical protein